MSPQAVAILSLFETLPRKEKKEVFETLEGRHLIYSKTVPKESKIEAKVIEFARIINANTPNL